MTAKAAKLSDRSETASVARQRLAAALEARGVLREVALQLSEAGIAVLPLKGVLLQSELYGSDLGRRMLDVDVLVRPRDYHRARRVLCQKGATCRRNGAWECSVCMPGRRYPVDLHRRLLLPVSFGLSTAEVFARARPDSALFGVPVWLPDPLDLYAHLVGHCLASRAQGRELGRFQDFGRVAQAGRLDPVSCAQHLQRQGLARAARHVLARLCEVEDDPFAAAVLRALPHDPVGELLVLVVRATTDRVLLSSAWGALGTHALARSLPAGALGLTLRVLDKAACKLVLQARRVRAELFADRAA